MNKKEIMKNAREDERFYLDLDEVVAALETYKKNDINVFIQYNDKNLYSLLDDRDSCYMKVTGKTYEQYNEDREAFLKHMEEQRIKQQINALERIPEWTLRGYSIIYPQQRKQWDKCIKKRIEGPYVGDDLENALEIMEMLAKEGDLEKAYKIFDDANNSGGSAASVLDAVITFSEQGTQFYGYLNKKMGYDIRPEQEERLNNIDEKFKSFHEKINDVEDEKGE